MNFITHTDADGILSALLFKEYNPEHDFKGFYNLQTFYLTGLLEKEDVAIDLDMDMMNCIGHHINPIENPAAENPNNRFLKDKHDEFYHKCPFNTALLLVDKYKIPVKNKRSLALLLLADGFYLILQKYKGNCKTWLERYNLKWIMEEYEKNPEIYNKIIFEDIVPIFSKAGAPNGLKAKFSEDGTLVTRDTIKTFSKYVIDAFDLKNVDEDMFNIKYSFIDKYKTIEKTVNTKQEYLDLVNELKGQQLISSALVNKNKMKITYKDSLIV